jgi:integrase
MRKSNGKWYVRFELDGVEYSAPTGLAATERNRARALKFEAKAKLLAQDGRWNEFRVKSKPFNEAADSFISWAEGEYKKRNSFLRIRSSFTAFRAFFGSCQVSAITPGRIEDFKTYRREMKIAEVSIRHDLHNLSLLFQYCVKHGWARSNAVMTKTSEGKAMVKIPSDADAVRMNILTPEQEELYFATCLWMHRAAERIPSPDKSAYQDLFDFGRLMIQQGCRPEEFLELRKESVDLIGRWMYVVSGKTKAARRRLKLTRESVAILSSRSSVPGPFVFPSPLNSQRHRGPTWRVHSEVLNAIRGKRNASDFVVYDLRHTFATRAAKDGMPIAVLAATLGHANIRSVMKYVHIDAGHIDEAMLQLEQLRFERGLENQTQSFAGFLPGRVAETGKNERIAVNREF